MLTTFPEPVRIEIGLFPIDRCFYARDLPAELAGNLWLTIFYDGLGEIVD